MASRRLFVVLVIFISVLLLQCLHDVEARGGRGGRSRSTQRSSFEGSRRHPVQRKQRIPTNTYSSKVSRNRLIKPENRKTFQQRFVQNAVLGVVGFRLYSDLVYGHDYAPYNSSYIIIPTNRALRIVNEEYRVKKENGENCTEGNLTRNHPKNVLMVTTNVSYKEGREANTSVTNSTRTTVNLMSCGSLDGCVVNVETRTRYNESIIDGNSGKNCTVMLMKTQGYIVEISDLATCCNALGFTMSLISLFTCFQLN